MILVFLSMYGVMFLISQYFQLVLGYTALGGRAPPACRSRSIMLVVAPLTPRLSARFGAHRTVAFGMLSIAAGLALFNGLAPDTSYAYVVLCVIPLTTGIALSMSPMTASIMAAVPARRAGAGSAMNDATRELGAALGIAILGSVAASHYAHQDRARSSGGCSPADQDARPHVDRRRAPRGGDAPGPRRPGRSPRRPTTPSSAASTSRSPSARSSRSISAVIVYASSCRTRWCRPARCTAPVESLEEAAELGLGGVPPIFADTESDEQRSA